MTSLTRRLAHSAVHAVWRRVDRWGEIVPGTRAADRFRRIGTRVAVSPAETIRICRDKWATSRHLLARGVAAAVTYLPSEVPTPAAFPLFVKPRVGRGGVGAFPIRSARELEFFLDYVENPVVQQYLDGREYTIDMLCDFAGRPVSIVPRERVAVAGGQYHGDRWMVSPENPSKSNSIQFSGHNYVTEDDVEAAAFDLTQRQVGARDPFHLISKFFKVGYSFVPCS